MHTLGVDGGYSQQDVTQVARVFTGWTIKEPNREGDFEFDESKHEPGKKIVLGHVIKEGGQKEGMEVLDILAHNPATARFICTKLAMRFVSDTPPQDLVDRMAQTFQKSDGDIREVLKTMLKSPEFWSPESVSRESKNTTGVCGLRDSRQRLGQCRTRCRWCKRSTAWACRFTNSSRPLDIR